MSNEQCVYCKEEYPAPVSLHHDERECQMNNETKHTPEPWEAMEYVIYGPAGSATPMIAEINQYGRDFDTPHANARRIVACVNACAGVSSENLEQSRGWIQAFEQIELMAAALRKIADGAVMDQSTMFSHGDVAEAYRKLARDTLAKL